MEAGFLTVSFFPFPKLNLNRRENQALKMFLYWVSSICVSCRRMHELGGVQGEAVECIAGAMEVF